MFFILISSIQVRSRSGHCIPLNPTPYRVPGAGARTLIGPHRLTPSALAQCVSSMGFSARAPTKLFPLDDSRVWCCVPLVDSPPQSQLAPLVFTARVLILLRRCLVPLCFLQSARSTESRLGLGPLFFHGWSYLWFWSCDKSSQSPILLQ
jgi:hypothetical protein